MFKKKVTYDEVCKLIITQASEISAAALKSMEEQLTSLDDGFKIPDQDKADLDVMLAVVSLELRVAVNKLKKSEAEKIAKGVHDLFGADADIGEYSTHELDLYDDRYTKALAQGANPMSGVGSHLLFRISGDNKESFTDDGGKFNMLADMVMMDVLIRTTAVVKMVADDYKLG